MKKNIYEVLQRPAFCGKCCSATYAFLIPHKFITTFWELIATEIDPIRHPGSRKSMNFQAKLLVETKKSLD